MNRQIIDEAATWFVELNEGEADTSVRQKFDAWLRASPQHVSAYLRMLPIWEQGAGVEAETNGDPAALIAWARAGDNIVPLAGQSASAGEGRSGRGGWTRRWMPAAAVLAGVAMLAAWLVVSRDTYATATGEQRLIALSDGSQVELNARSRLRVRFTGEARSIELLAGQALFRVAPDKDRPFTVVSGDTRVRVLGTQFDVYRKKAATVVTVVEGRVAVSASQGAEFRSAISLSAGEQIVVTPAAAPRPKRADVAIATAWTQQRLAFSRTPLREVAEEFNRYNERQLSVQEGALQAFNVSGTFSSADPASLVRFLRAQPGIRVEETDAEIRVSAR